MRSSGLRSTVIAGVYLLLVACTGGEGDDPLVPDAASAVCTDGDRRCDADLVEVCDDGDWTPVGLCVGDRMCSDGACIERPCEPDCQGLACGDDGCGGSCGICPPDGVCQAGRCVSVGVNPCGDGVCSDGESCATCPADCGRCCGDGVCAEDEDCATCLADCACGDGERCDAEARMCVPACVPVDCAERACGSDGCGGDCGTCPAGSVCDDGECGPWCGDGTCDPDEGCATCPADCGACCGDGACTAPHGEDCATCPADCACGPDGLCDDELRACAPVCQPACAGRTCGPDGCGGVCGVCAGGRLCDGDGACVEPPQACGDGRCAVDEDCATCPADCGQCCGDGACTAAGGENCATCPADCACDDGSDCDPERRACVERGCVPDCFARVCGTDGCDGLCGLCDDGELCDPDRGRCEELCLPDCGDAVCGPDGCGGVCGECSPDEECRDGGCLEPCMPQCEGRTCGPDGCGGTCAPGCADDQACTVGGRCVGGALGCDCPADETCVAGVCRRPSRLCSADAPDGFCPNGEACVVGVCTDVGTGCSLQQPAGTCPVGALCIGGGCRAFDAAALCDDGNPCTADVYDPARDACRYLPQDTACTDGDPCTDDRCIEGICVSDLRAGCAAPPAVDPLVSPTNQRRVTLAGDKPAGWAVLVDDGLAVPESPAVRWSVELGLAPGANSFRVVGRDPQRIPTEERTVRVIYDPDPPATRMTPGGGVFRDGVTVTLAANEPATVYYTTDGSQPGPWSPHFESVHTVRVFEDTTIAVRARDRAGNWQPQARIEHFEISGVGTWHGGEPLVAGRQGLAAASDGRRIFVLGGWDGAVEQSGVAMYADGEWSALNPLAAARTDAAAAWVDGSLYAFGGRREGIALSRVDRLQPDSGRNWSNRRNMPSTRFGSQAVAIGDRIHVFGGESNGGAVLAVHEIYDTVADTWSSAAAPMPRARTAFGALRADDGRIYLVGGRGLDGRPLGEVDVYDPQADAWSQIDPLPTPRSEVAVGRVANDGRVRGGSVGVLVSGGRTADGAPSATVEEYVIDDARWRVRRPLTAPRTDSAGASIVGPAAAGAADDQAMQAWVIGGEVISRGGPLLSPNTRFYTRDQDHLQRRPDLPVARRGAAAASVDDKIFVVGGGVDAPSTSVLAYDPETGDSRAVASLPGLQVGGAAVGLAGRLWVVGGENRFGVVLPTLRSYDPGSDSWTEHQPMLNARRDAVALVVGEELAVIGGENGGPVQSVEFYDPRADRWRPGPILERPRSGAVGGTWQGRIYVAGGQDEAGPLDDLIELDGDRWRTVFDEGFGGLGATAAMLNGRLIIVGGRDEDGQPIAGRRIVDLARDFDRHFMLTPETRLLAPADGRALVAHRGELYLLGGAGAGGQGGRVEVDRYAGRCLDGDIGPYEGRPPYADFPDLGAGCGDATTTVALDPTIGYGHHGPCDGWNECGDAETCADLACGWYGHGPAHSYRVTSCIALPSGNCDLFRGLGEELDTEFDGLCNVSVVFQVVCRVE